ncbi:hypothetical protein CROQUDRAFT_109277 [Cronartium quercuum f. sp. fusiforme G11]|uniref:Uncharacterized protein n=1 Tax=Cronartium quercuum f. sp. fusiforme G11 TaxID=708437 RepID=A0A9P6NCD3_9BASI|nr:hypothetical protein CROQUDRAFT_109277 [Cronartium quercuum f. sp. fusiforme G11]
MPITLLEAVIVHLFLSVLIWQINYELRLNFLPILTLSHPTRNPSPTTYPLLLPRPCPQSSTTMPKRGYVGMSSENHFQLGKKKPVRRRRPPLVSTSTMNREDAMKDAIRAGQRSGWLRAPDPTTEPSLSTPQDNDDDQWEPYEVDPQNFESIHNSNPGSRSGNEFARACRAIQKKPAVTAQAIHSFLHLIILKSEKSMTGNGPALRRPRPPDPDAAGAEPRATSQLPFRPPATPRTVRVQDMLGEANMGSIKTVFKELGSMMKGMPTGGYSVLAPSLRATRLTDKQPGSFLCEKAAFHDAVTLAEHGLRLASQANPPDTVLASVLAGVQAVEAKVDALLLDSANKAAAPSPSRRRTLPLRSSLLLRQLKRLRGMTTHVKSNLWS